MPEQDVGQDVLLLQLQQRVVQFPASLIGINSSFYSPSYSHPENPAKRLHSY
jgi:hypothetical protein